MKFVRSFALSRVDCICLCSQWTRCSREWCGGRKIIVFPPLPTSSLLPWINTPAERFEVSKGKLDTPNINVVELMKLSTPSCINIPADSNELPAGLLRLRPLQGFPSPFTWIWHCSSHFYIRLCTVHIIFVTLCARARLLDKNNNSSS